MTDASASSLPPRAPGPVPLWHDSRSPVLLALLALPFLVASSLSPSTTVVNQLLAVAAWGLLLLLAPPAACWSGAVARRLAVPSAALLLILAGIALSAWQGLPGPLALGPALGVAAALGVMLWAAAPPRQGDDAATDWVLGGLLTAALLSALVGLVQVFWPAAADGQWLARTSLAGRAVGNLRQPNHLSTLLIWGLMALAVMAHRGRWLGQRLPDGLAAAMGLLLVLAVVLTASRTGVAGILLLAVWGLCDKRLRPAVRWSLVVTPLLYLGGWLLMSAWAEAAARTFGGQARLAENDLRSSRLGIWRDTLTLIAREPWTGVGFGNFNFAWSLSPLPQRPPPFFDHSHNLALQWLVELGLPLGGLVLLGLGAAAVLAGRAAAAAPGDEGVTARGAWMIVLLAGLHSLFEYPLWYLYFLLPTAWALGRALRAGAWAAPADAVQGVQPWPQGRRLTTAAGAVLVLGALAAALDYQRVVVIYQPGPHAPPLDQRIAAGQRSPLYGHHADYAAATLADPLERALAPAWRTAHSLLDTRLMLVWLRALEAQGDRELARHLAQRLREFGNPDSREFLAECQDPLAQQSPRPVQCEAPQTPADWRAFQALDPARARR
ncbi:PglL family O-oligosaccharyltransferase [Ideonella livida]|uniref:Polymerase n=1 Tax=Ideonella livida TaxID=2707176 RepID=A0A7C9TLJ4_9BURK|nr:O-antigen ligase family protein [Ideonella livida]NDY91006.1 polymerase [Ideonella livida]